MAMNLFKTKKEPAKGSSIPRVTKLPDHELVIWMDNLIMQLGASYDVWRDHDELPSEVDKALEALNEVWAELKVRHGGRPNSR